jgi:hypothetical protein
MQASDACAWQICNHPDLLERSRADSVEDYGAPARSGKLTVALKVRARHRPQ